MRILALAAVIAGFTSPLAHAQRAAVSAELSPEEAGEAFRRAVIEGCIPAAAGNGVSALPAAQEGKLQPTQDAETRRQVGASPDETVWDVADARGVVTVRDKAGRCVVSVYGPPSAATMMGVMGVLSASGFEAMVGQAAPGGGFVQTMLGSSGGKRVTVQLSGSEPGSPGHQSKFSVVTAIVTAAQ